MGVIRPFNYNGIKISESVIYNKQPYFTGRSIGEWLGYRKDEVARIVRRNPYVLDFSREIEAIFSIKQKALNAKLASGAGYKIYKRELPVKVRVFDPIGLQLIVMKSNTPMAKKYQIFAAKLVWAVMNGKFIIKDNIPDDLMDIFEIYDGIAPYKRSQVVEKMMEISGKSRSTIYLWIYKYRKDGALINRNKGKNRGVIRAIPNNMKEEIKKIVKEKPDISGRAVYIRLGSPRKPSQPSILKFIRRIKENIVFKVQ